MTITINIYDKSKNIYLINIKDFTDNELDNFILKYKILLNSNVDFKIIFSALELENISFRQIVKLGLFLESFKPVHRKNLNRFCICIKNNKIIKILNGLFMLVKPVRPYILVSKLDDGVNYMENDLIINK